MGVDLLVINPPNSPFTSAGLLIEPIDVLTVATWLKSIGYAVNVRDLDKEQILGRDFERILIESNPRLIIIPFDYHIPLYSTAAIKEVLEIVKISRAAGRKVVVGGRPATANPALFLIDEGVVVVRGEMELALQEIVPLLLADLDLSHISGIVIKSDCKVKFNEARKELLDLDRLPIPDRSLLPIEKYIDVNTILSSRGCVERCIFCPVPKFWGRWRRRSAQLVVDEISYLVREFGAKKILFLDDHATVNSKRMRELSRLLINAKVKVALGCLGTVKCCDIETLKWMREAGFAWIHYGCEFADDKVLTSLQKGITVEQIEKAIMLTRSQGIRVRTSWIFDSPGADSAGLERTCNLIVRTEPEEVRIHFMAVRGCSELFERLGKSDQLSNREQYIHASSSHENPFEITPELTMYWSMMLSQNLQRKGYRVVKHPEEWCDNENQANSDRFVSFCPGRYGVGWEDHSRHEAS